MLYIRDLFLELPTEREMDLWAELQATKDTLRVTEDEVTACKREKVKFLETMTKITVMMTLFFKFIIVKSLNKKAFSFQSYIPDIFFTTSSR